MDEIASLGVEEADDRDNLAEALVRADLAWINDLVDRRKRLGLSQAQVAEMMGRTQSAVSDIETMGTDPRLSTLRRYALAIGMAVVHLVVPTSETGSLIHAGRPTTATAWVRPAGRNNIYVSTSSNHVEVVSA